MSTEQQEKDQDYSLETFTEGFGGDDTTSTLIRGIHAIDGIDRAEDLSQRFSNLGEYFSKRFGYIFNQRNGISFDLEKLENNASACMLVKKLEDLYKAENEYNPTDLAFMHLKVRISGLISFYRGNDAFDLEKLKAIKNDIAYNLQYLESESES